MRDQRHLSCREVQQTMPGRREAVLAGVSLLVTSLSAAAQGVGGTAPGNITVTPGDARPGAPGAAAYFTGSVFVEPLFPAREPSRASGGSVTFQPGARSAWHTHPLGQTLIVTAGSGWVQLWGSPKQDMRQGDVVWIPPGLKHWHGATATTGVTHIAIQEQRDGSNADWMEHVTDAQYRS